MTRQTMEMKRWHGMAVKPVTRKKRLPFSRDNNPDRQARQTAPPRIEPFYKPARIVLTVLCSGKQQQGADAMRTRCIRTMWGNTYADMCWLCDGRLISELKARRMYEPRSTYIQSSELVNAARRSNRGETPRSEEFGSERETHTPRAERTEGGRRTWPKPLAKVLNQRK